jgi:chromosome segregation ATPase
MTKAVTRARLEDALTRLLAGQPARTDGELTVSNLCREAEVGRDSYYRSEDIVGRFEAAKANAEAHKPEVLRLRDELADAKREHNKTKTAHARAIRELEDTIRTYANQIQALALRNAELEQHNQRLRERLDRAEAGITQLADHR